MAYATILVRFVYFVWSSDSCPHEWDMAVPLSLYLFCVLRGVVVPTTTRVCVVGRYLLAVSETWRMPLS